MRVTCAALSDGVAGALWSNEWGGGGGQAWEQRRFAWCGAWEVTYKWTCVVREAVTPSTQTHLPPLTVLTMHALSLPCFPSFLRIYELSAGLVI